MIYNAEAEQSVIGAMLIDEKAVNQAIYALEAEDFFDSRCAKAFLIAKQLASQQLPVDAVTVLDRMGDDSKVFIVQCVQLLPTASNVQQYIDIVKREAMRRRAIEQAQELLEQLESKAPVEDCAQRVAQLSSSLAVKSRRKIISAAEGFDLVMQSLKTPREFMKSGFQTLDNHVLIEKGDYIVIGGRPSAGKTALSLHMAMNMAKRKRVVYFSCETNGTKAYSRMVANHSITKLKMLKTGDVSEATIKEVEHSREPFSKLGITLVEAAGATPEEIKALSIQLGADIIFIDYLTLLRGEGHNDYARTTFLSKELHIMAQQTGITVVVLSQLNREGADKPPRLQDLRESGQIEQDADAVIFVYKDEKDEFARNVAIAKNKEGETGVFTLGFDGATQRFSDRSNR